MLSGEIALKNNHYYYYYYYYFEVLISCLVPFRSIVPWFHTYLLPKKTGTLHFDHLLGLLSNVVFPTVDRGDIIVHLDW